jgi:transcriptional regulator with GAF, ATPase, and Fis domain
MATFSGSTAACTNPAAITAGSPQRRKGLVAFSSPKVAGHRRQLGRPDPGHALDSFVQCGMAAPAAVNPVSGANSEAVDIDNPNLSEKERVIAALERAKATRILGMTPHQIAYRIQTLNIEVKQF